MERDDPVLEALRLLIHRALDRIEGHPAGHLLSSDRERLELNLELPLGLRPELIEEAAAKARRSLDDAAHALLVHRSIFRPGCVLCLRCRSTECEHAVPTSARSVFTGYSQSGVPQFTDFGEHLLATEDPRVGELFDERGGIVTRITAETELMRLVLPSFRRGHSGYRIHGQVLAGWYRIPDESGSRRAMAVSFQIVSSQPRSQRRRFGLNVLGIGPGREPLEHLHDRLREVPWSAAVRWGQSALRTMSSATPSRIEGILGGLARRLERGVRSAGRRTNHANERHEGGERPTRMALIDLSRAESGDLYVDPRHGTRIVVGGRGRCHVFSPEGKLVTSVRYPANAIEKKRKTGAWVPATEEELSTLRQRTGGEHHKQPDKTE